MINKIHNQDCLIGLKALPDNYIDCCVTSPPYYGLRDYGKEGQIGLEETPEAYVAKMVEVFTEVRRVLKKEGTLWLNLGDSYSSSSTGSQGNNSSRLEGGKSTQIEAGKRPNKIGFDGIKPKDLIGIPWMVAFALRSSGWYLRQDIIWHKPNPMPESVTDRCTKAHEYIFLLSKAAKYYYDGDAISEISLAAGEYRRFNDKKKEGRLMGGKSSCNERIDAPPVFVKEQRNKRSVWTIPTKPYKEAHFATFPPALIIDCIKAGCPENGIVLDPFMGAGTTAVVSFRISRNFIGFELNEKYITIAEKRIEDEFGVFNKYSK